eukprot:Skav228912  [mRNA]  locus=scaffold2504:20677:24077:+ [translate_table: standard]
MWRAQVIPDPSTLSATSESLALQLGSVSLAARPGELLLTAPESALWRATLQSRVLMGARLGNLANRTDKNVCKKKLCVWDPFCGKGTLLLEALGIAMGVPPGSPDPWRTFPNGLAASEVAVPGCEVLRSIQLTPHPDVGEMLLLGSHDDEHLVQLANLNLQAEGIRRDPKGSEGIRRDPKGSERSEL